MLHTFCHSEKFPFMEKERHRPHVHGKSNSRVVALMRTPEPAPAGEGRTGNSGAKEDTLQAMLSHHARFCKSEIAKTAMKADIAHRCVG